MSRIAVITDSNSGINFEDAKELGIKVLPMPFLIDGKTYFEEISLSQEEFLRNLKMMLTYRHPSRHRRAS